jgi:hypothetical protein
MEALDEIRRNAFCPEYHTTSGGNALKLMKL